MRTDSALEAAVANLKMAPMRLVGYLTLLVLLLASINLGCTHHGAGESPLQNRPLEGRAGWPHTNSDLHLDPSLITGVLENGMRYVLKHNRTPLDRVSMHLYVQTGSLHEKENEQGIAHFLEHMLFNGSTHFAPGEMVKYFQRIGMQFGPDANAHTGFLQTVYDVILPTGTEQSVTEGLLVLKDFAQGALLLPEETEKERKVILAEMRSRDSAEFRAVKASFRFEMPGALIPQRFPIGRQQVIEQIDADMLRVFYDTWYRPERMVLVMVGDFQSDRAIPLIKDTFNDLRARRPEARAPVWGQFAHHGIKPFYYFEEELGETRVRIETVEQIPHSDDSMAIRREQLYQDLANRIVKQRLDILLQKPETVFTDADISAGVYLQHVRYAEISAECKPQHWRRTLAVLEQELRRALEYGFTPAEIDRVKKAYLAELARDLEESNTRNSVLLARHLMADLGNWRVFQSPEQRRDLLGPMVAEVTAEQLHHFFRKAWSASHRLVLVTGNAELVDSGVLPQEQILSAYHESTALAVLPPDERKTQVFPYLPDPPGPGSMVSRELMDDIGVTRISFANGMQLLVKPTRFKENQVLMALSFGNGLSGEPVDRPGLAQLSEAVVNASGFGRMDQADLEAALAGYSARINLSVQEDRFVVRGEALAGEFALLVQLLYTFVMDPGFRPEAFQLALKRNEQIHQTMMRTVEGALRLDGYRFLAGGDSRFGFAGPDALKRLSLEQVRQWLGAYLARAPMELAVVGDIDLEELIEVVGRYLGNLPPRSSTHDDYDRPGPTFPTRQSLELEVASTIDKSLVVVAYPTDDFWDIGRSRRLNVLAGVFSERLREQIRERLGAAYSPFAYNHSHRAYPGFGIFQIHLTVDPHQTQILIDEVKKIAIGLTQAGIGEDEFRRILDPTLTGIKDLRQSNNYWLSSVLTGASRYPQQLSWARTIEQDYAAIRGVDIVELANRYLNNDMAAVIVINPKPIAETTE